MNHLTDEQFEDLLRGTLPEPEHLSNCEHCKMLLAEKKALANRLCSAFASVKPDENLVVVVRAGVAGQASSAHATVVAARFRAMRLTRIAWPAAAAAVLLLAIMLGIYVIGPAPAMAAPAELVRIHQDNLSSDHEFYSESNPDKLAEYFKSELGFIPSMPTLGHGMAIRGCCIRHFKGQIVGSYVVDTPQGVVSIIVVTDEPHSLGMGEPFEHGNYTFWKSSFAKCDMVTVRLGDYSYCAVGELSHEYLTDLLSRLIPQAR